MYLEYYGLKLFPFANTADPRFFFASEAHEEALANMSYAIEQGKGMVLITGEVGTGKTLLSNVLSLRLRRSTVMVTLADPLVKGDQLMRCVQQALLGPQAKKMDRLHLQSSLMERLITLQRMDQKVAVLVDESQDLCRGALEQLRLMSNWENRAEKLIQWVLVGQPELRDRLQQPEWEHLRQRVVLTFHLQRLQKSQAGAYIRHRLEVASGGQPRVSFEEAAMGTIYDASGGAPRLINNICEATLLAGFAHEQNLITNEMVANVVRDMTSCGWSEGAKFAEKNYQLPMVG